jgi:hypothetical protein
VGTPSTFPGSTGVGGVSAFNDPPVIRESVDIVAKKPSWLMRIGRGIGKGARFIGRRAMGLVGFLGTMEDASEIMYPQGNGDQYIVDEGKLDYIFGKVDSSQHSYDRSQGTKRDMEYLSMTDTEQNRDLIRAHLTDAAGQPNNITGGWCNQYGEFISKESIFPGPTGRFIKVRSSWQVLPNQRLRLTTVIFKQPEE